MLARWLRAAHEALLGEMPILAAGTALFAIIAVVPTLAAAVAIYGLVADPARDPAPPAMASQQVMPLEVVSSSAISSSARRSGRTASSAFSSASASLLALFSARGSARALIDSLNRAYRVRELRRPLHKLAISLADVARHAGRADADVRGARRAARDRRLRSTRAGSRPSCCCAGRRCSRSCSSRCSRCIATRRRRGRSARARRPMSAVRCTCRIVRSATSACRALASRRCSCSSCRGRSRCGSTTSRNTELVYGAFGSVIVTLLWFYLSTMALMIGGFVNAELERHAGAPEPERSTYSIRGSRSLVGAWPEAAEAVSVAAVIPRDQHVERRARRTA